jgi:glyoxylase-like metal-dependent hydrolase (beta-lactamase superfamily II)
MIRETFPVGMLACNCTVLGDPVAKKGIVIDPGDECDRILEAIDKHDLDIVAVVHTHAHVDHIGATGELCQRLPGTPALLHAGDIFLHDMLSEQARFIGMPAPMKGRIDAHLTDAQALPFGRFELAVLHTPGHTPGSCCFQVPGEDICFSGDTLFAGGVGRTDLWGGDFDALERSISGRLYTQNGAVQVVPGHGPPTSIDRERRTNPFVRG